jgi:predicted alpha/beta-fold hydrolase
VTGVEYQRERITTPDHDFIDLDWSRVDSSKLVIFSHGLEGSSRQPYILGMVKEFNARGWDALAWNFRSCSGELNHSKLLYSGGSFHDLKTVIDHATETKKYKQICLVGYSLGGSITLKYLADYKSVLPKSLKRACVFSVPCDLYACARNLSTGMNRVYLNRFLVTLKNKVARKAQINPGLYASVNLDKIQDFIDFDNYITAPMSGFKDAIHYYIECSSKHAIPKIETPTLIVNAFNDPFLHPACFPTEECQQSKHVFFEGPYDGGHIGFMKDKIIGTYWSEERAIRFLEEGKCKNFQKISH